MQWMMSHQEARRNLEAGKKIYANSMIAEEIAFENKEKQLSKLKQNQNNRSVQMDKTVNDNNIRDRSFNTDVQIAKKASVSEKTYRIGAKVLNSDNEDIKERVLSGETSISAGYKELTQKNEKE